VNDIGGMLVDKLHEKGETAFCVSGRLWQHLTSHLLDVELDCEDDSFQLREANAGTESIGDRAPRWTMLVFKPVKFLSDSLRFMAMAI
jgi:hypothetical protein